jgi:hypothetical protein
VGGHSAINGKATAARPRAHCRDWHRLGLTTMQRRSGEGAMLRTRQRGSGVAQARVATSRGTAAGGGVARRDEVSCYSSARV